MGISASRLRIFTPCTCCRTSISENSELSTRERQYARTIQPIGNDQFIPQRENESINDEEFGFSKTEEIIYDKNRFMPLQLLPNFKNTTVKGHLPSTYPNEKQCKSNKETNQRKTLKQRLVVCNDNVSL